MPVARPRRRKIDVETQRDRFGGSGWEECGLGCGAVGAVLAGDCCLRSSRDEVEKLWE